MILVGVLAFDRKGVSAVLFYLVAYGFATIAAFAIVNLLRQNGTEATHLSQWAGLGKRYPVVAGAFAFLMLAFAGIPLTSGFVSKFAVFSAAIGTGGATGTVLAIVGVICSAITVFVYARVIVLMFFSEPPSDSVVVGVPSVGTEFFIAVGTMIPFALGVLPSALLDLAAAHPGLAPALTTLRPPEATRGVAGGDVGQQVGVGRWWSHIFFIGTRDRFGSRTDEEFLTCPAGPVAARPHPGHQP